VIEDKYKKRYQEWKDEFLSTEIGRAQWEVYSRHPHFALTITVARVTRMARDQASTSGMKRANSLRQPSLWAP